MAVTSKKEYRALVGLSYTHKGESRRAEAGDIIADLPSGDIYWLVEQGAITDDTSEELWAALNALPVEAPEASETPEGSESASGSVAELVEAPSGLSDGGE